MITGLRKADLTLGRPYGTYLHVFREHLLQTPRWLIIGYGFSDSHVNEALRQAVMNWKQRGKLVQVALIDYLDGDPAQTSQGPFPTRGAEKLKRLVDPVFSDFHVPNWNQVNRWGYPQKGIVRIGDSLAVQFEGVEKAMTNSLADIVCFLRQ
jgi:hypothetical protein